MDASAVQGTADQTSASFKSRPGALVWFFRKSRDLWKGKSRKLRGALKREQNQVAAVTKSREQWKSKAQAAAAEQAALRRENEALREQLRELTGGSKKSRSRWD
jgi:predicted nuclease with TOPRIM domain